MTITTQLPRIGDAFEDGTYAGVTTNSEGLPCAVVLLPVHGVDLDWRAARAWAGAQGGEIPTRLVASLLFFNLKARMCPRWHWTAGEEGEEYAWNCDFYYGCQNHIHKSYKGDAVAVRMIPLLWLTQ